MGEEEIEEVAVRMIANGNGSWPVREDHAFYGRFDEVAIAFPLETVWEVHVFLRKGGETLREYHYHLRRVE